MNNEELHYATPLMRTLSLIHQRNILDHPPLYPWDSDVTMDCKKEEWASLISMGDVLKERSQIKKNIFLFLLLFFSQTQEEKVFC